MISQQPCQLFLERETETENKQLRSKKILIEERSSKEVTGWDRAKEKMRGRLRNASEQKQGVRDTEKERKGQIRIAHQSSAGWGRAAAQSIDVWGNLSKAEGTERSRPPCQSICDKWLKLWLQWSFITHLLYQPTPLKTVPTPGKTMHVSLTGRKSAICFFFPQTKALWTWQMMLVYFCASLKWLSLLNTE